MKISSTKNVNIFITIGFSLLFWAFGILTLGLFFISATKPIAWGELFITSMLVNTAYVIGILIGFLFAIPRTIQESSGIQPLSPPQATTPEHTSAILMTPISRLRANTNLEQVSDWLTKILLGIGLTQFNTFKDFINGTATKIVTHVPDLHYAQPLIAASIIYFFVVSFLGSYIACRMWLIDIFSEPKNEQPGISSTAENLSNLQFSVQSFSSQEKELLQQIIAECEQGNSYILPEEFTQDSSQYHALEALKNHYLLKKPNNGDKWQAGGKVDLTPIAQKSLDSIKNELSSDQNSTKQSFLTG